MSDVFAVEQITKQQAINYAANGYTDKLSDIAKFEFQIRQRKLAMDFSEFQRVTEVALNREVYTHEFADPKTLWDEYNGKDVGATDPFTTWNRVTYESSMRISGI